MTLTWTAPTQNTNGSALTDLAGYEIYYGTSATSMQNKISIPTVGMLTYVVTNLSPGAWYFTVTAVNALGVQSGVSGTATATL